MQARGAQTRRAILDATRELLEDAGPAEVGMGRIADHAGCSRQAVYRHFGSRAGLLKDTLADIDERAGAAGAVEAVLGSGDAVAALDSLVAWWATYVAGFVGVARGVYVGRRSDPALAAAWEDRMEALTGVCRLVVDRCAVEGRLRAGLSRSEAVELLWAMLSIPLWDQLAGDRGWSRSEYRERVGLIVRASLVGCDPPPPT